MAAIASVLPVLLTGWHLPAAPVAITPSRRRPSVAITCSEAALGRFMLDINLGEGDGIVRHAFTPYFSSSQLLTFRYPVPFTLEAEPIEGVIRVMQTGAGLIEGDVLRAFSTLEMRYDSATRERRYREGIRGTDADENERKRSWQRCRAEARGGLGLINPEVKPQRCLFVSDGQPFQEVIDALVANTPEKTSEIVMVFERPDVVRTS